MEPFAVVGLASFRVTSNGYWTWKHVVIFYSTRLVTDGIDDHLKSLFRNLAFSIWLRMKDFTISFSSWPLLFSIFQAALLIFDIFRRSWWWLWWSNLYSVYRGMHWKFGVLKKGVYFYFFFDRTFLRCNIGSFIQTVSLHICILFKCWMLISP